MIHEFILWLCVCRGLFSAFFLYFHNFSYQCPEFDKFDPNKCYFRGKIFNIREDHIADETEATERCELPCECYKFDENTPAEFECPEDDSCDVGITECIIQYSTAEKCCNDLKVCGK